MTGLDNASGEAPGSSVQAVALASLQSDIQKLQCQCESERHVHAIERKYMATFATLAIAAIGLQSIYQIPSAIKERIGDSVDMAVQEANTARDRAKTDADAISNMLSQIAPPVNYGGGTKGESSFSAAIGDLQICWGQVPITLHPDESSTAKVPIIGIYSLSYAMPFRDEPTVSLTVLPLHSSTDDGGAVGIIPYNGDRTLGERASSPDARRTLSGNLVRVAGSPSPTQKEIWLHYIALGWKLGAKEGQ